MIYGLLQVWELIKDEHIHYYLIFFLWVWVVWLIKFGFAKRYRVKYTQDYQTSVSVIIPTYNEDPDLFKDALQSTVDNNPDEIIIVFDSPNENLEEIARSFPKVKTIIIPKNGKRTAFATGLVNATGEIIILKDSDTILPKDCIRELIKPFIDPKVGGVTPRIHIFNPDDNWIRRITEWIHDQRDHFAASAQGSISTVACLPGPTCAFRRKIILGSLNQFLNEKFMGTTCETGDDRSLTNITLKQGYQTVFQKTAIVYTDSQNRFLNFWRQQIRWARSSQKYTLMSLSWMFKKPKFFAFYLLSDLIAPFFYVAVLIVSLLNLIFRLDTFTLVQGTILGTLWFALISGFIGINFSFGVRQLSHLRRKKADIFWLPIYLLVVNFILIPVRILGFFTMTNQQWMTR